MVALRLGAVKRLIRERNDQIRAAHLAAKLTAYAPSKATGFVKIERLLIREDVGPRRAQTVEEQIAIAKAWSAAVNRPR